jgi:hypothetical protein
MSRLRVHNGVYPGNYSWREDDQWVHAPVWEYLFTHPIAEVGAPASRRFDDKWKLITPLRSGPRAASKPSRQKQIPSSQY